MCGVVSGRFVVVNTSGGSRISQGGPTPSGVRKPNILQNFCRKLHENERIWRVPGIPLDPPLNVFKIFLKKKPDRLK